MTPEAKVKKEIRKILSVHNAYYAMPIGSGYGNSGTPDFLVCYKGRFIGIEAKAGNNTPTALQQHAMESIGHAGGITLVVNETSVDSVERLFKTLDTLDKMKGRV